jgi:hypothetical protein
MGAAFEIQSQTNIGRKGRFDARPTKISKRRAATRTDHEVESHQSYDGNNDAALQEILLLHHQNQVLRLFLDFLVDACHSRSRNLKNGFVGASDKETGFAHSRYDPNNSASSHDTIADFQILYGFLQLSLSFLLRPDEQHVENADDKQHRQKRAQGTQTTLKKKQESVHWFLVVSKAPMLELLQMKY